MAKHIKRPRVTTRLSKKVLDETVKIMKGVSDNPTEGNKAIGGQAFKQARLRQGLINEPKQEKIKSSSSRVTSKAVPEMSKLLASASKTISENPTASNKKIGGEMFTQARKMQNIITEIDRDTDVKVKSAVKQQRVKAKKETKRSTPAGEAKSKFALSRLKLRGLAKLHGQQAAPKGGFSSPITSSQGGGKGGGLFLHPRFGPKKTL